MIMISKIDYWEDSLIIKIPKYIVEELALSSDDEVECHVEQGQLMIRPVQKFYKYTLSELLSQELESETEIDWGKPEGNEEW